MTNARETLAEHKHTQPAKHAMGSGLFDTVWSLAWPGAIWAIHFLASYWTAAVYCAKFAEQPGPAVPVQWAFAIFTVIAWVPLLWFAYASYSFKRAPSSKVPHDADTLRDRRAFIATALQLLTWLSIVATFFTAMVGWIVGHCH